MASTPCPPGKRLLLLLDERLPAGETETLTCHRDACLTCQQILEELPAGRGRLPCPAAVRGGRAGGQAVLAVLFP